MKKCISVLVLLAIVAGSAFALDLSAGGGLLFDVAARNGLEIDTIGMDGYAGIRNIDIGGFLFFDATYAELDFYFAYGVVKDVIEKDAKGYIDSGYLNGSMVQLGFSLVGKHPFELGKVTVFPLAGISYNIVLSYKNDSGVKVEDWTAALGSDVKASHFSQFGFLFGAGLDVNLTSSLFLRSELAIQIRLPTKGMKTMNHDAVDGYGDTTVGLGPRFKLGVGYKF